MRKKHNTHGGGVKTIKNGSNFERMTSLDGFLQSLGFDIKDNAVYQQGIKIGLSLSKTKLYTAFLQPYGIDYRNYNSKQWQPDECFINLINNTAYIIEKKYQETKGSVDEKLPNCAFKKWEYEKLLKPLGYKVEFIYILSEWFKQEVYKDTLEYIQREGCYYFFDTLPLIALGLETE